MTIRLLLILSEEGGLSTPFSAAKIRNYFKNGKIYSLNLFSEKYITRNSSSHILLNQSDIPKEISFSLMSCFIISSVFILPVRYMLVTNGLLVG